jgi:hypothetical protein
MPLERGGDCDIQATLRGSSAAIAVYRREIKREILGSGARLAAEGSGRLEAVDAQVGVGALKDLIRSTGS